MIDISEISEDDDLISKIQIVSDSIIDLNSYKGYAFITDSSEVKAKRFFEIKGNTLTISKTQYFGESCLKLELPLLTIKLDDQGSSLTIMDESINKYQFEFETHRDVKMFNDAIIASIKSISSKMIHFPSDGSQSITLKPLKDAFMRNENDHCFECRAFGPEWCNPVIGITICSDCSKYHRRIASPIGMAKGLWLDNWKLHWIDCLILIGNVNAKKVWINTDISSKDSFVIVKNKYLHPKSVPIIKDQLNLIGLLEDYIEEDKYFEFYKLVFGHMKFLKDPNLSDSIDDLYEKCTKSSILMFANLLFWLQIIPKASFFERETIKTIMKGQNTNLIDLLTTIKKSIK